MNDKLSETFDEMNFKNQYEEFIMMNNSGIF